MKQGTVDHRLADVRRRDRRDRQGWCILRTSSRRTLSLARSLNDAGIEAWTPSHVIKRRVSRHKPMVEHNEAIIPSFVFVQAPYLEDLLRILAMPNSPHPAFTIFQHAGRAPVIADAEIANLRHIETLARVAHQAAKDRAAERASRAARKALRRDLEVGSVVKLTEGAYAGMSGIVESINGADAIVCFGGLRSMKVASWLFIEADVVSPDIIELAGPAAGVSAFTSRRSGHRAAA